jgi:hypothetical protein
MSTRRNLRGVATANTWTQLSDKTWAELSKWHKRSLNAHWFNYTNKSFYHVQDPKGWFMSAVPWDAKKSEAFAGLHGESDNALIIYDEASKISDDIWEVSEGALTTPGSMWFVFGNPTRNTGRFADCFGKFKHRWITRKIDSRTAKMADRGQIDEWIEDYGEDSDFVRVRVRGEFPRAASNQLIPVDVVRAARERIMPMQEVIDHPVILGVDVAREGDDCTTMVLRQGYKVLSHKKYRENDTMMTANIVAGMMNSMNIDGVIIDQTGMGVGVVDRLREMGYRNVWGVAFNSKAIDRKYFNIRAEMWGHMGDWLKSADIPDEQEFEDDLIAPEYFFRGDDHQIQLERKKDIKVRLKKSPDLGDGLGLTFAMPVRKKDNLRDYRNLRGDTYQSNNIRLY